MRKISVLIPTYNSQETISESLDSVLSQDFDDFDIIIVDDGSTDSTINIIEDYASKYDNIQYIENEHLGLSETLNFGLYEAQDSKYTVRLDSDDIMLPNRLKMQYHYMEEHSDVDILSGGMIYFNESGDCGEYRPNERIQTYRESVFDIYSFVCHPTVIIRNESLFSKLDYFYTDYFKYCEDTELWNRAARAGLKISTISEPLVRYRLSDGQISQKHQKKQREGLKWLNRLYFNKSKQTDLTCIINFKNEKTDVERTLNSIFATANPHVILINDSSDDGFDYDSVVDKYNNRDITYIKNKVSIGASRCRDLGVVRCKTEYFVLMDCHLRFYTNDWDKIMLNEIKQHNDSVICFDSILIEKRKEDLFYKNESGENLIYVNRRRSPYIDFENKICQYTASFNNRGVEDKDICDLEEECSCVLGGCYLSSKTWWNKIRGYYGLIGWGFEEPLISIKTFLFGGKCFLSHLIKIGHVYRNSPNYKRNNSEITANRLYVAMLFEEDVIIEKFLQEEKEYRGEEEYEKIIDTLSLMIDDVKIMRDYIEDNRIKTIEEYKEFNRLCREL